MLTKKGNRPIPANAVNPIVEVNLEDNKLSAYRDNYTQGYHHGGEYVKNVVLALEKQHHYKQLTLWAIQWETWKLSIILMTM